MASDSDIPTQDRPPRRRIAILLSLAIAFVVLYAATIVLPYVFGTPEPAKIALTKVHVRSALKVALDLYKRDVGHFPGTLDDLITPPIDPADEARWRGRYIKSNASLKDAWGNPLIYRIPGLHNPNGYDLSSPGPDGVAGTGDDIANW